MAKTTFMGLGAALLALAAMGCSVDEVPDGLGPTPAGSGATVRWNLYKKPLPDIPFPNDQAMFPDPTSRTGLRVNGSVVAPTNIEIAARERFDRLEGFGTFAPISVSFQKAKADDPRPAIDLQNVIKRHQGDDYELANDAVYLVNLDTGIPAFIDLGEGSFQQVVPDKNKYFTNDTRRSEQVLLWETADETIDPATGNPRPGAIGANGLPVYKPEWDTDFDGVLDRPNLIDPSACATQVDVALGKVSERDRDRCLADKQLSWYERETDSLIMRPLLPLAEQTQYAVVITDRLVDADGKPVRSPFDFVYHPSQEEAIQRLESHLSNQNLKSYYGDIGGTGLKHVSFAWTFTTQPVVEDMRLVRDGLYGHGPLAKLAGQFPVTSELKPAAGKVTQEALDDGAAEEPNWEQLPECVNKVKNRYIVKFDDIQDALNELAKQGFGIKGPPLDALLASFKAIDHIAVGTFKTPFFIHGGPKGTDPNASFNYDFRAGEGELTTDTVQYLIAVPKKSATRHQPFPVAYYGHGYTSSMVESLGFAGHMAAQGIASIGMNAVFHTTDIGDTERKLAENLFVSACEGRFGSALLSGRARDLDGDGKPDSGGDYWTSYLFHTRDVVRQSAIDQLQMFRMLKSFDGKRLSVQDYNGDGQENDLAGDFDGDGTPDVGGPNVEFYAWGQSLGAILSPFAAALDPGIVAAAPTSGSGGLLNLAARTIQGGAFEGIYLRDFGPLVVGVPAKSFKSNETKCSPDQISLRFEVVSVNNRVQVEFNCLDKAPYAASGGTVLVYNLKNGQERCARMDKDGLFRIGIPSSLGDKLALAVYDQPDVVDSYDGDHGCNVTAGAHTPIYVKSWGDGLVPQGTTDPLAAQDDPHPKVICSEPKGCSKFQNKYFPAGSTLTAIAEGYGYIRQTPNLRRILALAANIIDPGDPVNYAPYYALHPMTTPDGKVAPPKGVLNMVTIGDMNVPLDTGIALGRAGGAVPFLTPDAVERYPAYADYVTPQALYQDLGGKTPNRALIENHVLEGIARLERESPSDPTSCRPNEVPVTSDLSCHPNCTDSDTSACLSDQICVNQRCVMKPIPPTPADGSDSCVQYLYDIDNLDEGAGLYGEHEAPVPLRLARIAMPATPDSIDAIWQPRLAGKPHAADVGAWKADRRVLGQLAGYIQPTGEHGFDPADPCKNWDSGQYLVNLIARFFASSGSDLYYLSHPGSHECLARPYGKGSCPFVVIP